MTALKVGKIRDAHGMKGELFLISFARDIAWLNQLSEITLEGAAPKKTGKHELERKTFKIQSFKPHKKGAILRLEGITHRTDAEYLIGYMVEVPFEKLTSQKGESIFLVEIEGFEVFDGERRLGPIVGFSSNNAQDLLIVEGAQKYEIPLIPEFLEEIVWGEKKLRMKLPPGLVENVQD